MQTTISSKHMDITPAIADYAEKKASKLRRFFNRIQQIDVIIDKAKKGYTVEIITDVEHHEPFIATAADADLYACIDQGAERAARQLKDHKSRLRDNKHIIPNSHTAVPATALRPGRGRRGGKPLRPVAAKAGRRGGARGKTA
jgi:putative sigma-54 modulation protein